MVFRPRQKRLTLNNFAVKLCDTNIERVKEVVFLGVILDEHLSWKSHIAHLSSKVSRSIGIIYKSVFASINLLSVCCISRLSIPICIIV